MDSATARIRSLSLNEPEEDARCDGNCSHRRDWTSMLLAREKRGAIIGKGGATIKALSARFSVKVDMNPNNPEIQIYGRHCHAEDFKREVEYMVGGQAPRKRPTCCYILSVGEELMA